MSQRCETCHFLPCRCEDLAAPVRAASDGRRVFVAGVTGQAGWPRQSDAMGVHPDQAAEAYQESVDLGVPTQYDRKGFAIVESEAHQRKLGRALKLHENNCFNW